MSKETRGNVKPWEAVVKAGVATVLAAGMTPAVALAQDADNADSNRGGGTNFKRERWVLLNR